MSETKREGHIRRITNALIADEAKVGIHFTHDAVVELLELLKVQPEPCEDAVRQEDVQSIAEKSDWFESSDSFNDFMWALYALPSVQPEVIQCKDCKHNPKDEWFGCPMSHLNEKQRPETAWCWKGERRTDERTD